MRMMKLLHALGIHAWGPHYPVSHCIWRRMCFICRKRQERIENSAGQGPWVDSWD